MHVTLFEDHNLFAEALAIVLSTHGHDAPLVDLPDDVGSVDSLIGLLLATSPDVVLLDLDLGLSGVAIEVIDGLLGEEIPVVVLTGSVDHARWGEYVYHGVEQVVPKNAQLEDLLATLRRIEEGLPPIHPEDHLALIDTWRSERAARREARDRLTTLTSRERQVLDHLAGGRNVDEIARIDAVSPTTVRTQVKSILAKLEVSSQLGAVAIAHRAQAPPS